jgi:hypothetical protein
MCAFADCKDGLEDGRMDTFQWLTCRIATIQKAEEFFGDTRNLKNQLHPNSWQGPTDQCKGLA